MKKETLEGLFKKGLITEETFNKGIQKFSNGGVVQDPTITPQANPQTQESPTVASVPQAQQSAQEKSPVSWMSDEQWAQTPAEQKLMFVNPALAREELPSSGRSLLQKGIEYIGEKRAAGKAQEQQQLQQVGLAPKEEALASDIAKAAVGAQGAGVQPASDMVQIPKETKTSPYEGIAKGYDEAFAQMQKGIMSEAEAGAKQAAAMTSAYTTAANDLQKFQQEQNIIQQEQRNKLQEQAMKMEQSIDDFKKASVVDPNRFWANRSTGDKVMASIAVFLGGLGGGDNQALQVIDNAIMRDIEAQKQAAMGAKGKVDLQNNIYQNMMNQFQNESAAFTASRLAALNIAEMQVKKAEAATGNAQAKARAQAAMGQLGLKKVELQKELLSQVQNSTQMMQSDDETRAIMRLPENMRQEAFNELGAYKAIQSNLVDLDKKYNELIKISSPGERVKSPIQTSSLLDKAEADLFPIIKSIVGEKMTDSDARILIKSQLPNLTDSDETKKKKLDDLKSKLSGKIAERTPRLTGFGIIKPPVQFSFKRND